MVIRIILLNELYRAIFYDKRMGEEVEGDGLGE